MRSDTASRAVSISTGTRLPASRRRLHTSMPSMPGIPTSSTTASGRTAAISVRACCPPSAHTTS